MRVSQIMSFLKKGDKRFRKPRIFSNEELRQFAHLFSGKVLNASGWNDADKQGAKYKDYFSRADSYHISNYDADKKGMQGFENEFYLDLEASLSENLRHQFDVVFNHTTLEHVFDVFTAFSNLAELTKDVLIVVVPYLQQVHGLGYYDYWRFTPHTMEQLYARNNIPLRYLSANGKDKGSIYLVCIGYKDKKWDEYIPKRFDLKLDERKELYGSNYKNVIGSKLFS